MTNKKERHKLWSKACSESMPVV